MAEIGEVDARIAQGVFLGWVCEEQLECFLGAHGTGTCMAPNDRHPDGLCALEEARENG